MTSFLEKRVKQHNLGQNKSTKGFLPWDLGYYEEFQTRGEARIRFVIKSLKNGHAEKDHDFGLLIFSKLVE